MTKYDKDNNVKEQITQDDLKQLLQGSQECFNKAVEADINSPMGKMHHGQAPVAIALCQGAATHYHKGEPGYTDFDVYLFYEIDESLPPRQRYPASRPSPWQWCYENAKYPNGDIQVDVLVRYVESGGNNPTEIIRKYLQNPKDDYLAKDAVVLLDPPGQLGKVIWYDGEAVD